MPSDRCPLCMKVREYDLTKETYLKFQNSERLICRECSNEVEQQLRPTWHIVGNRVFPKSMLSI